MKNKTYLVLLLLIVFSRFVISQAENDKIIAIVGDEIITQSDLNTQILLYARENNIQPSERLASLLFDGLINDKLILAKAKQDSIYVTEEEINKQVEFRYQQILSSAGSEKNVQETYGLTISEIKEYLREDFKDRLLIDRYKQEKFGYGISVSRSEVIDFYNRMSDSIPLIPETFELLTIAQQPKISQEAKDLAYSQARVILDSIRTGADFSRMAIRYSADSMSAIRGGNLGKVKKGNFVKEFEDAAFTLREGEISEIVESQFGYHIIKLNDKTGDIIDVSHILISIPNLPSSDNESIRFLKDLKASIGNDASAFKLAAVKYSHDQRSARDSGYIGFINLLQLDTAQIIALRDLYPGQVSDPVKYGDDRNYYYIIFFVLSRIPEHRAAIETDYMIIENMARTRKENLILQDWYKELKETIHIEKKVSL